MKALQLDFLRSARRGGWASYALAALALAFAGDVALSYRSLQSEVAAKESRLAHRSAPVHSAAGETRAPDKEEIAFARETLRRLSTPWEPLFRALEGAQSDRVALLVIEPDAEAGTVSVTGEARDYLAALTYVANLAEQKGLRGVHLVRHEVRGPGGAVRPVAFTVSAAWQETR